MAQASRPRRPTASAQAATSTSSTRSRPSPRCGGWAGLGELPGTQSWLNGSHLDRGSSHTSSDTTWASTTPRALTCTSGGTTVAYRSDLHPRRVRRPVRRDGRRRPPQQRVAPAADRLPRPRQREDRRLERHLHAQLDDRARHDGQPSSCASRAPARARRSTTTSSCAAPGACSTTSCPPSPAVNGVRCTSTGPRSPVDAVVPDRRDARLLRRASHDAPLAPGRTFTDGTISITRGCRRQRQRDRGRARAAAQPDTIAAERARPR